MNRIFYHIIRSATLMLLMQSCIEEIEFRGDIMEPKLVLYSVFDPDSVVTVNISRSQNVFDIKYNQVQITDAVVRLLRDGEVIETLTYCIPPFQPDKKKRTPFSEYRSQGVKPVSGYTYRIEVDVPGFSKTAGETRLPDLVPILKVDTASYEKDEHCVRMTTKVRFTDQAGQDNFYMVSGSQMNGYYTGDRDEPLMPEPVVSTEEQKVYFQTEDEPLLTPDFNEDLLGIYSNYFNIFSDELIDGKQYDLNLMFSYCHNDLDPDFYEFSHTRINLTSISRDLYMYLHTYSGYIETGDLYISEPVLVYSNIENGLGVIGSKISSTKTVEIGRYPVDGVNYLYNK